MKYALIIYEMRFNYPRVIYCNLHGFD